MVARDPRGEWGLPLSMFFGAFARSFALVSLPLSIVRASIAHRESGTAVVFVSSSRIAAALPGPVIDTTLLAWMPSGAVDLALAGMGLLVVPLLAGLSGPGEHPKEART